MPVKLRPEHIHPISIVLVIFDILVVSASYLIALWLRFDCRFSLIEERFLIGWRDFLPVYVVFCLIIFWVLKLYKSLWRFASFNEFTRVALASVITGSFHVIATLLFFRRMPISYYVLGMILQFLLVLSARFSYRFVLLLEKRSRDAEIGDRVMLIGAGEAGQMILRDIQHTDKLHDRVVCVIDDDPNKWGRELLGAPVVGGRDDILSSVEKYKIDKIYFAIPTASEEARREILNICSMTDCELKRLPGIYQLVSQHVTMNEMQGVSSEDMLGRPPVQTDMNEVYSFIHNKTVLVTGGGGSIGSELCRQIAAHGPARLIVFDIYENGAYDIQLELKEKYPNLQLETLIGSVRDSRRIFEVFETYRPEIVYHAAAHKHVPLMEDSPAEAVKNNAIGTYKTAYAAMVHGCERFVLISTDKAVNPTNIMGASKRLCEMVIQSFDAKIKAGKANELPQLFTHDGVENVDKDGSGQVFRNVCTRFVAVRFGNVLGSNGSVIPVFKRQIAHGGPVTVTHPDVVRYFMTISEAVSLVMLAGTYAKGGEIFVLDMGDPVKIDTLARNLIKMSGFRPDVDIKIEYSGLRPGEKLYEEKLMAEEGLDKTPNKLIHIGHPIPFA